MSPFGEKSMLADLYTSSFPEGLGLQQTLFRLNSRAFVGEAVMNIRRIVLAVIASTLAMFAVQAASASADPGMYHDGIELAQR